MGTEIKFFPKSDSHEAVASVAKASGSNGQIVEFSSPNSIAARQAKRATVDHWFREGVMLEEKPETINGAIAVYEKLLELEPNHAATCINLGTIYYNKRDFQKAEAFYRKATEIDPNYALAWFDLGNVLDECLMLKEAEDAYKRAIEAVPTYADVHYNLALCYERMKEPNKALKHWQAYVKLDSEGPWAKHARWQINIIRSMSPLRAIDVESTTNETPEPENLLSFNEDKKLSTVIENEIPQELPITIKSELPQKDMQNNTMTESKKFSKINIYEGLAELVKTEGTQVQWQTSEVIWDPKIKYPGQYLLFSLLSCSPIVGGRPVENETLIFHPRSLKIYRGFNRQRSLSFPEPPLYL